MQLNGRTQSMVQMKIDYAVTEEDESGTDSIEEDSSKV